MSYTDSSPTPTRTYEIVPDLVSALSGDSDISTAIGDHGEIFENREYIDLRDDDNRALPDRYIVVREPVLPGGVKQNVGRLVNAPIQIVANVSETHPNPEKWLGETHRRIFELLVGREPSLSKASVLVRVSRLIDPTNPQYHPPSQTYFSSAEYRLLVGPP